jgi:hypothetical protein
MLIKPAASRLMEQIEQIVGAYPLVVAIDRTDLCALFVESAPESC